MMTFIYQFEEHGPKTIHEISPESTLDEVLDEFRRFLLVAGYPMEGRYLACLDEPVDEDGGKA